MPTIYEKPASERGGLSVHWLDAVSEPQWYAVYTTSRHEKRVAQHLTQREIEYYLPLYKTRRQWRDGSRVTLELPLFPGYLFVRIRRTERVRVLDVPGALSIVGSSGRDPVPLPDDAIEALRSGLRLRIVEPHATVAVGQRARIRSGVFAGTEGIVLRDQNGFRVILTVGPIQPGIAVKVHGEDLEPIGVGDLASLQAHRSSNAGPM